MGAGKVEYMVTRVFVEKKQGFNIEAQHMLADLKGNLGVQGLEEVRILNRYDVSGLSEEQFAAAARTILSEPTMDAVYGEEFRLPAEYKVFAMEYLPGQYDQRADSAAQCVQLLTQGERPAVLTAKVIGLKGRISDQEFEKVKGISSTRWRAGRPLRKSQKAWSCRPRSPRTWPVSPGSPAGARSR